MGGLEGGVEPEVRLKLPVILGAAAAAELRDHLARVAPGIFYERLADMIFVAAILDLRRAPAAIRRRLGLHERAAEFLAGPGLAPPSALALA